MKKSVIGLACLVVLCAQAQAQSVNHAGFRGIVGAGFTFGGDEVAKVTYDDHSTAKLYAGRLFDLRGGVEYQIQGQPVAVELTIGYHFDKVNASNGSATFQRFPLDLVVHYAVNEYWRAGLGLRKSLSPKLDASFGGVGSGTDKFTASAAPLVEAEFFVAPQFSFKGRYVAEKYKWKDAPNVSVNGSHFGLYGMYYF